MNNIKFYALLALAVLAFVGCAEDDIANTGVTPAQVGDEIVFGGKLDQESTRTVYGDKNDGYTEVKWVTGDGVGIYCAESYYIGADNHIVTDADGKKVTYREYKVVGGIGSNVTDGVAQEKHSVALTTVDGGYGLRWGSDAKHTFYGVYPTKSHLMDKDQEAANALSLEGNTLKALLPNMQGAQDASNNVYTKTSVTENVTGANNTSSARTVDHFVYYPAMRNAYMVAKKESTPVSNLTLTFEPVVTAVEITLQNLTTLTEDNTPAEQDLEVEMITISHPTAALCGAFSVDLNSNVVTNTNTGDEFKAVSVPTKVLATDNASGNLLLNYGDKVTFTAFLALDKNEPLDEIQVSVLANGQLKTATLKSATTGIQIVQAKKKNFISAVKIGYSTEVVVDYSHWVTDLIAVAPNTTLGTLSIPGAGGATSYAFDATYVSTNGITDAVIAASREQTLNINELWDQGVRCFEFMVDNASSFGSQNIFCNGIKTTTTLNTAVDAVAAKIAATGEFGMVIITYQEENYTSYDRNAGRNGFADYFGIWWKSYNYDGVTKKLYDSSITVEDAKKCLFCIGRPVAAGLDAGWYTGVYDDAGYSYWGSNPCTFSDGTVLNVLGWGNNADQWYVRGFGTLYYSSTNDVWSATNPTAGVLDRPYHVGQTSLDALKPTTPYVHKGKSNFEYKVSTQGHVPYNDMTSKGWIQEWRRVVPSESTRNQYGIAALPTTTTNGGDGAGYYYYWEPSEDEKWDDVVEALDKAIDKTGNYTIYLNSLCGYFVDGSISMSYLPRLTYQRMMFDPSDAAQFKRERVCMDDKYMRAQDDTNAFGAFMNNHSATNHDQPTVTDWGPYTVAGGFRGNIAAYADWVNTKFYNLLLQKNAAGELAGKSTGIVMMDHISNNAETNEAGYYIPRIIIATNFSGINTTAETKLNISNITSGDQTIGNNPMGNGFSVVWNGSK